MGLLVQLGGVFTNYDTYIIQTAGGDGSLTDRRHWEVAMSPAIAHWKLLKSHVGELVRFQTPEVTFGSGFYGSEGGAGTTLPRWTSANANIIVQDATPPYLDLNVGFADYRPANLGQTHVDVLVNGSPLPRSNVIVDSSHPEEALTATVPLAPQQSAPIVLTLHSNAWVPAQDGKSTDHRDLGIHVDRLTVTTDHRALRVGASFVEPLPVSDDRPWSREAMAWFYGADHQVLDVWEWYLWYSGMPRRLLLVALIPLVGLLTSLRIMISVIRASDS
jgi:hypothetical protein